MILGDLGAEVIKIEAPTGGDDTRQWGPPFIAGESAYYLSINRNKKSVTLDLDTEEGRNVFYDLAAKCDVVIENFRPGVTERLQIDYHNVSKRNPKLIYCSITSYGHSGPYKDWPAYDIVIQGMGGLMGITGEPDRPPVRIGVAISDLGAGMYAAIAILAALAGRQRTGRGQLVDVSLLDSTISWMTYMAAHFFATGRTPERMGSAHPSIVPYQCFKTKDGEFITIAIGNDKLFHNFCEAVGLMGLADDAKFSSNSQRVINRDELIPILERQFNERTREEWLRILSEAKLPAGPVYSMADIFSDPQVLHRQMLARITHPKAGEITQIGIPMKFSNTKPEIRQPPPLLGEQTDEILKTLLGYHPRRIAELHERHVV
jgi:crotonobetainyl-CoA:carnitine CoA-transferase CaiB-like acyl-CoA transferase